MSFSRNPATADLAPLCDGELSGNSNLVRNFRKILPENGIYFSYHILPLSKYSCYKRDEKVDFWII